MKNIVVTLLKKLKNLLTFTVQQPATAPNAAAGVQAMVQAVDTLGQQLVTWMDGVLQHQR